MPRKNLTAFTAISSPQKCVAPKRMYFLMIFREREAVVLDAQQSSGREKGLKRRLFGGFKRHYHWLFGRYYYFYLFFEINTVIVSRNDNDGFAFGYARYFAARNGCYLFV